MGREIRLVKKGYEHTLDENGVYAPLMEYSDFKSCLEEHEEEVEAAGNFEVIDTKYPDEKDFMPDWSGEELDHMAMYENTTEGTPLSPIFHIGQKEELAQWLVDNNASAFGGQPADKEWWLNVINKRGRGFIDPTIPGVVFL